MDTFARRLEIMESEAQVRSGKGFKYQIVRDRGPAGVPPVPVPITKTPQNVYFSFVLRILVAVAVEVDIS